MMGARRFCLVTVTLAILAFPTTAFPKDSWGEISAAALEISVDEFTKIYGKPEKVDTPEGVSDGAKELLKAISAKREKLASDEMVLETGSATLRAYMAGTGLLLGTAAGAPLVGMAIADSVHAVVEKVVLEPAINDVRTKHNTDVAELIGSALRSENELATLHSFASSGNQAAFDAAAAKLWADKNSMLSKEVLGAVPEEARHELFQQGTKELFKILQTSTTERFNLTNDKIGALKKNVGEVQKELGKLSDAQATMAATLNEHIRQTTEDGKKLVVKLSNVQSDVRSLQESVQWQHMSTSQRISALEQGWFADLDDTKRRERIDQLTDLKKVERVAAPINVAADTVNAIGNAAKLLGMPKEFQDSVQRAQKNIATAQAVMGIAAQVAMGNYLGALGGAGGLLGGGGAGGDASAAQHAAVMKSLAEINQKLDKVIKLQEATLREVKELRKEVQGLATNMNRRFNGIEEAQFKLVTDVLRLYWQGQGSEDCRDLMSHLEGSGDKFGYNHQTGLFKSYAQRANYYKLQRPLFAGCERFVGSAVALSSTGAPRDFFHVSPNKAASEQWAQESGKVSVQSLGFLTTLTPYRAMRQLHSSMLADAGKAKDCGPLFLVLSAGPLHLEKHLSSKPFANCNIQYDTSRRNDDSLKFEAATEWQIDLERLIEYARILDMFSSFRLLQNPANRDELRSLDTLRNGDADTRTQVVEQYRQLRDLLAIASAQQSMLSGSAVAKYASDVLAKQSFGHAVACGKPNDGLLQAAACAAQAARTANQLEISKQKSALENAKTTDDAEKARRALRELRPMSKQKLANSKEPHAVVFVALGKMAEQKCVMLTSDQLSEIDKSLAVESAKEAGRNYWEFARITCLMEELPMFRENISKVLTLDALGKSWRTRFGLDEKKGPSELEALAASAHGRFDFLAAVGGQNLFVFPTLLPGLPVSGEALDAKTTKWSIEVVDKFGWSIQVGLPLAADIGPEEKGGATRTLSSETDTHLEISLLRAKVDSRVIALTMCSGADASTTCSDDEIGLIKAAALASAAKTKN